VGNLANVRRHWDERRRMEAAVLQRTTIEESAAELDFLYRTLARDDLYDREKEAYLTSLQERIRALRRGKPR
jgi:hypothetical protein